MNKSINRFLIILMVGATILSSCKKDEEDKDDGGGGTTPVSKLELITGSEWIQISQIEQFGTNDPEEMICGLAECQKDNLTSFLTNLDYKLLEGDSLCNANDPYVIYTGEWFFSDNDTKVVLDNTPYDIVNLSGSELKLRRIVGDDTFTSTYVPNETYNAANDLTCFVDTDGDGVGDDDDCAPNDAAIYEGATCDDFNPATMNDMIQADCTCAGTAGLDTDGDGVPDAQDCAPNDALVFPGAICDDGDANTTNDMILADCTCAGTAVALDSDFDGIEDGLDNCPNVFNPNQEDSDLDGIGDACETTTNLDLIANVQWNIISNITVSGTDVTDNLEGLPDCELDNVWVFLDNNTYAEVEGETLCNVGDPLLIDQGTWLFSNGDTVLTLDGAIPFNIISLTATTLILQSDILGDLTTITMTVIG